MLLWRLLASSLDIWPALLLSCPILCPLCTPAASAPFLALIGEREAGEALPFLRAAKSGLPFQKFFLFLFFIFQFVFLLAFFRVKWPKIAYFLDVWVVIGWRNAKFGCFLGIFRRFRVLDKGLYVLH